MLEILIACFGISILLFVAILHKKAVLELRKSQKRLINAVYSHFPDQTMIQRQFNDRLREAGWDFEKYAEEPVHYISCIDCRGEINRPSGCRFYAYMQVGLGDVKAWEEFQQHSGFMLFRGVASVDLSLKKWRENGFSQEKCFLLLDKYLGILTGLGASHLRAWESPSPQHSWPHLIDFPEVAQIHRNVVADNW